MSTPTIAKGLTLAGALPFICLTVLSITDSDLLSIAPEQPLVTYGAVIVSFISGIHWGHAINNPKCSALLWHSNIVALLAWLAAMQLLPFSVALILFCFIYLLIVDYRLYQRAILPSWFWRLRLQITSIVTLSLLTYLLSA